MLNSSGTLRIRTYTAGGALPVSGAIVRIRGAEEGNQDISYSVITDRDGVTPKVTLPAPDVGYSLSPNPAESPFATYDVEITMQGYYPKRIFGLTVFSGVDSIQLVNMIPGNGDYIDNYPRGSQNAIIPETNFKGGY